MVTTTVAAQGNMLQVLEIPLEDIVGEHPEISTLAKELSLPPYHLPPFDLLTENALQQLASLSPITVVKQKPKKNDPQDTKYLCIGNLRLFRWCKAFRGPKTVIPVIVNPWLRPEAIRENHLLELLIMPPLLGVPPKGLEPLAFAWDQTNEQRQLDTLMTSRDIKAFERLFGVDHRILKKKKKKKNDETNDNPPVTER